MESSIIAKCVAGEDCVDMKKERICVKSAAVRLFANMGELNIHAKCAKITRFGRANKRQVLISMQIG